MPYRKGRDCVLSLAGVEVIRATDVNPTRSADELDTTTRSEGVWKGKDVGHNEWGVSLAMNFFIGDTAMSTLAAAYKAQTEIAVSLTLGALGTEAGVGKITRFDETQAIGDIVKVDIDVVGNGALS